MIVCLCANVNEKQLQQAIEKGSDTHEKLVDTLGVCNVCCHCHDEINTHLEDGNQFSA